MTEFPCGGCWQTLATCTCGQPTAKPTPPATIPVAGLEALVEELRAWRHDPDHPVLEGTTDAVTADAYDRIADRLAQLIQEAK